MDGEPLRIDPAVLKLVPIETCLRHNVIPLGLVGRRLTLAMADPSNLFAMDDVRFMTGLEVIPQAASVQAIRAALAGAHANGSSILDAIAAGASCLPETPDIDLPDPAPVVTLVNDIVRDAIRQGASHVHLDPTASSVRVSFRIDGVLTDVAPLPAAMTSAIASRLKIMAKLDIAEKRVPQDGRFRILSDGSSHDILMCTLPVTLGERIVLKFPAAARAIDIDALGFPPDIIAALISAVTSAGGLVLIAGADGSGRTTTIYAVLERLQRSGTRVILTAEDPVRRQLDGIGQTRVRGGAGFNKAAALTAMLRQDPDVMMVSRIADEDTAAAVVQAASDGHAILTSITASGAPEALSRLVQLGCAPVKVANSIGLVFAQRMVRRICDACRSQDPDGPDEAFFHGAGCAACGGTGYRGRLPIGELMTCSGAVRTALCDGVTRSALRAIAVSGGMKSFADRALDAALAGQTTIGECRRVKAETESA